LLVKLLRSYRKRKDSELLKEKRDIGILLQEPPIRKRIINKIRLVEELWSLKMESKSA